jgi:AcrR family transcriptional regulator
LHPRFIRPYTAPHGHCSSTPKSPANRSPKAAAADFGTRERLLAAGLELARRDGLKGVSVRAAAASAEVNLGSFVYHFGTRDTFVYELVERWYAPLMASLQLSASGPDALRDVGRRTRGLNHDRANTARVALCCRCRQAGGLSEPVIRRR